jgi:hypothetical protein
MGGAKQAQLQEWDSQELDWQHEAEKKGHRCGICGNVPSYDEREVYFDTGYCAHCAYLVAKDD